MADVSKPASGCAFHPPCRFAVDVCRAQEPELRELAPGHVARCHRAEEIALRGIGG